MRWSDLLIASGDIALSNGESSLNYFELLQEIQRKKEWLLSLDVSVIALDMANSVNWIVLDMAALEAKITIIPIPSFFTDTQRVHALNLSGAEIILCDKQTAVNSATKFNGIYLQAYQATQAEFPKNTAKVTYTSGSTGTPKGVCLSGESMLATAKALSNVVNIANPVHMNLLPLPTLLENIAGVYAPLLSGGTVYVPSAIDLGFHGSRLLDPNKLLQQITAYQPDTLIMVPELLLMLVNACAKGWAAPKSLQFIAVGGAKVSESLLAQAQKYGLPVYQGYGLSECGSVVCLNSVSANQPGSIGKCLEHVETTIENGELVVTGNTFLGYLGDKRSWYPKAVTTEDLVSCDKDGFYWFSGRSKNQLISSFGRNISPEWPESELLSTGLFREAVVVGDAQPHCVAILTPITELDSKQLAVYLEKVNERLPDYAQIKQVFMLDKPMTTVAGLYTENGRPNRTAINDMFQVDIGHLYAAPDERIVYQQNTMTELEKSGDKNMSFYELLIQETESERQEMINIPIIQRSLQGGISLDEYKSFLHQAYHHVKHTTPLLMTVGGKIPEAKEWLREAVAEYIEEELGHQEWILNDIANCGGDMEAARQSTPNFSTELLVSYAYDSVNRISPLSFFGMVLVLEGTSVALADIAADHIAKSLSLPKSAFSYLYSHGSLDQEHVVFYENLMNKIEEPEEQMVIIEAAKRFYKLYGDMFRELEQKSQLAKAA